MLAGGLNLAGWQSGKSFPATMSWTQSDPLYLPLRLLYSKVSGLSTDADAVLNLMIFMLIT
jgi:hypothetical protein